MRALGPTEACLFWTMRGVAERQGFERQHRWTTEELDELLLPYKRKPRTRRTAVLNAVYHLSVRGLLHEDHDLEGIPYYVLTEVVFSSLFTRGRGEDNGQEK